MGYFTQAHADDNHDEFDASDTGGFEEISETANDELEAAEEYILEQESVKAKKKDRAILKIRHAIEDYQERKRLKKELDYLSEDSSDDDLS